MTLTWTIRIDISLDTTPARINAVIHAPVELSELRSEKLSGICDGAAALSEMFLLRHNPEPVPMHVSEVHLRVLGEHEDAAGLLMPLTVLVNEITPENTPRLESVVELFSTTDTDSRLLDLLPGALRALASHFRAGR